MKRLLAAAVVCAVVSGAGAASAAPLEGKFKIDGVGDVRVGADYMDFFPFSPVTTGRYDVSSATLLDGITPGGSFLFTVGTQGTILDLNGVPVNAPVNVQNFVEFDVAPQWNFTVTKLLPGGASSAECGAVPATGQECTPPGSPFTLFNLTPSRSIVALSVEGFVNNGMGEISDFSGTFTSQLTNLSFQAALAQILDDEIGFVQSSWSAEFAVEGRDTPPVPEPASLVLMSLAFAGMGFAVRRRR